MRACSTLYGGVRLRIEVPEAYVTAEPGLRKKCHKLKGTAGPKRMRLMQDSEIAKGKKKAGSKMGYMDMGGSGPSSAVKEQHLPHDLPTALSSPTTKFVHPEASIPSSDSDF